METSTLTLSTAHAARITNEPSKRGRFGRRPTIRGHQSSRPLLEVLEARTLLSTDVVSNTNDSGAGSLRDTVANAGPGDTITFARGFSGAIILTSGPIDLRKPWVLRARRS